MGIQKNQLNILFAILAVVFLMSKPSVANAVDSRLQVFVEIEGSVPDWTELELTVTRLNVSGFLTNGEPFSVTPFDGLRQLVISRANAGSPRFLVDGEIPPGQVDQIDLTLEEANLRGDQQLEVIRKRQIPDALTNGELKLKFKRALRYDGGDVLSLLIQFKLEKNTFYTQDGKLAFEPVLRAELLSTPPGPENFLNDKETLTVGPTQTFPELGIQVVRSKVYNPEGDVRDLTLQKDTGEPVSFSEVRNQNETLWKANHGALEPALVDHLAGFPSTGLVLADIWLRVPGEGTFQTDAETPAAWDVAHSAFVATRKAVGEPIAASVSAVLEAAGATILSVELNPPVLHIECSREVLETVAAHLADVLLIVMTSPQGDVLAVKGAIDLVQNPLWLAHALLFGADLRIAIAEPEACINKTHEAFRGVFIEEPVAFPCTNTLGNGGHSTQVASALAATVGDPGNIDLVGLFQGNLFTSDICEITDALLERNPHLINLSCEVEHSINQRRLDHAVFANRIFVANGAGNATEEESSTLPVFCESYNSLCVGGYNHNGTLGPGNFGDDTPANRWLNDENTNREKPDVVGVNSGSWANPTSNDAYDGAGGTSYATPMVVGTAGLLMANFQGDLVNDPTLTRAVLMASASHQMQGSLPVPIYSDGVDDRTGAGAPRGDRAMEILEEDRFFTNYVDRNVDFDAGGNLTTPISFLVNAGDKVRVVLTYDQCQMDIVSVSDGLIADFDMVVSEDSLEDAVHEPIVHANNSHVDNSEIVEFTVSAKSQIDVNASVQHWDPCTDGNQKTYMAIAWDVLPAP